jgi:hypothetical protein
MPSGAFVPSGCRAFMPSGAFMPPGAFVPSGCRATMPSGAFVSSGCRADHNQWITIVEEQRRSTFSIVEADQISGSHDHHRVIVEDIIRVADIKSTMATQDEVLSILDEVSQVRLWMRYISRYVVLSLQNVPLIYFKNI